MYLVKTPRLLKTLYAPKGIWECRSKDTVYLTFDDGPHPTATPFVLEQLKKHNAKASFFCVGNNVAQYPIIYQRLINEGHLVANHTYHHINGWQHSCEDYITDVQKAATLIKSNFFRPPYGKIKPSQFEQLKTLGYQVVMWDLLSGDFDTKLSPEKCWKQLKKHLRPGSIVVFHDSAKAFERLRYVLPLTLAYCDEKKWFLKQLEE